MVSPIPWYLGCWKGFRSLWSIFRLAGWRKTVCFRREHTPVDTKVWAIPSSNCGARFVLAEWSQGKSHGDYEGTHQTHTDERTRETPTDSPYPAVARLLAC